MNVLLFANIGSNDADFYHVGDEAMFHETYSAYRRLCPQARLSAFSTSVSHPHYQILEYQNPPWPVTIWQARIKLGVLFFKALMLRYFGLNWFCEPHRHFVAVLLRQQRLHFCGGGNLTSLYPGWIYYAFFIILVGWLWRKEIILTSQTIGPYGTFDRYWRTEEHS